MPAAPAADDAAPELSIIVPAYNEEARIGRAMAELGAFVRDRGLRAEILVVDDGSRDRTAEVVAAHAADAPCARLVRQPRNMGKGAAVRRGVAESRGRWVLFTDADQSTPIAEWDRLRDALDRGAHVAIASREIAGAKRIVPQPWYRRAMGWWFMTLRGALIAPGFIDTQCGFKGFRGDVARAVFPASSIDGFCFDVEILAIAIRRGLTVVEVPVAWTDDPASRVRVVRDSLGMFRDLVRIGWRMRRGRYDAPKAP
ncbi:MAG: Polyprenol monophosphomannose synthase [Planctomycetes bacterium]|nr:Polyprenol monophosphomannose synthase [Planctomycetota bacterium]